MLKEPPEGACKDYKAPSAAPTKVEKKLGGGSSNERVDDLANKFDTLQSTVQQLLQVFQQKSATVPSPQVFYVSQLPDSD